MVDRDSVVFIFIEIDSQVSFPAKHCGGDLSDRFDLNASCFNYLPTADLIFYPFGSCILIAL